MSKCKHCQIDPDFWSFERCEMLEENSKLLKEAADWKRRFTEANSLVPAPRSIVKLPEDYRTDISAAREQGARDMAKIAAEKMHGEELCEELTEEEVEGILGDICIEMEELMTEWKMNKPNDWYIIKKGLETENERLKQEVADARALLKSLLDKLSAAEERGYLKAWNEVNGMIPDVGAHPTVKPLLDAFKEEICKRQEGK